MIKAEALCMHVHIITNPQVFSKSGKKINKEKAASTSERCSSLEAFVVFNFLIYFFPLFHSLPDIS